MCVCVHEAEWRESAPGVSGYDTSNCIMIQASLYIIAALCSDRWVFAGVIVVCRKSVFAEY